MMPQDALLISAVDDLRGSIEHLVAQNKEMVNGLTGQNEALTKALIGLTTAVLKIKTGAKKLCDNCFCGRVDVKTKGRPFTLLNRDFEDCPVCKGTGLI